MPPKKQLVDKSTNTRGFKRVGFSERVHMGESINYSPHDCSEHYVWFETDELKHDRRNLWKSFALFCQDTSLHGYCYVMEYDIGVIRRAFWGVVVIAALVFAIISVYSTYEEFGEATTELRVHGRVQSLEGVHFPAIVVCNLCPIQNSKLKSLTENFTNVAAVEKLRKLIRREFLVGRAYPLNENDTKLLESFFLHQRYNEEFDKYLQQEIIRHNMTPDEHHWYTNSRLYDWDRYMKRFYRQKGVNFSHDLKTKQAFFPYIARQHELGEMILYMRWNQPALSNERTFGTDFGICDRVSPHVKSPRYDHLLEDLPNKTYGTEAGEHNGLTLILDAEVYDYGMSTWGSEGFVAAVTDEWSMPLLTQSKIAISPGFQYLIAVEPEIITTTHDTLRRFKYQDRKCYQNDEIDLKFLPSANGYRYKLSNCIYEAAMEKIEAKCNCHPMFHNVTPDHNPCIGDGLNCVKNIFEQMGTRPDLQRITDKGVTKSCLIPCQNQHHKLLITHTNFPNAQNFMHREEFCMVLLKLGKSCNNPGKRPSLDDRYKGKSLSLCEFIINIQSHTPLESICPSVIQSFNKTIVKSVLTTKEERKQFEALMFRYMKENLAILKTFIQDPFAHKIVIDEAIPLETFLSNIGGLLGIFMGFSFLSGVEIVYHTFMSCVGMYERLREHRRHHHYHTDYCGETEVGHDKRMHTRPWFERAYTNFMYRLDHYGRGKHHRHHHQGESDEEPKKVEIVKKESEDEKNRLQKMLELRSEKTSVRPTSKRPTALTTYKVRHRRPYDGRKKDNNRES